MLVIGSPSVCVCFLVSMVNGEVIWKWNCESYSFKRFKWYLHYENWYSWWTESDWQIIWWLICVIVLISSSHDYDDFLQAMWVFHTSCIFLINIYDDDVYTTAYTPIYSVPFHGTNPHLRMWAAFSQNIGLGAQFQVWQWFFGHAVLYPLSWWVLMFRGCDVWCWFHGIVYIW